MLSAAMAAYGSATGPEYLDEDDDSPEKPCWACGDPDCYGDCEAAKP